MKLKVQGTEVSEQKTRFILKYVKISCSRTAMLLRHHYVTTTSRILTNRIEAINQLESKVDY